MRSQRTNIEIDVKKLRLAKKISGYKTTKDVVDFALERLAGTQSALKQWFDLRQQVSFNKKYNYKKSR